MTLRKNQNTLIYFVLSFILPVIVMFIVYGFLDLWPIGNKSIIINWDIKEQYSNYFAYLRTILKGENNFIYSFSKVLGGDMIGLTGYYLASPFNILFVIFDNLKIDIIILIITLLKLGTCGFTFNYFISKKYGFHYFNLLFSTSYALMAYNIVYQQNIMWLDGVILLPVIIMGIDKIVEGKSFLMYFISLFISIISNYYIGYMLGIISIIYYLYIISFKIRSPLMESLKSIFTKSLKFLGYTGLTVGSTFFFFLPVLESLNGGKGPDEKNIFLFDFSFLFGPMDFLSKMYTGAFSWHEVMDGFPLVFCGWFVLICFIMFLFNKNFSKQERIKSFFLILFLIFSMQITAFVDIFHGFNMPTGFPARNSFIFSFFVIYFGYKGFLYLDRKIKLYKFIICAAILSVFFITGRFVDYDYIQDKNYFWSVFAAYGFILALWLKTKSFKKRYVAFLLFFVILFICFIDLGLNAYISLSKCHFEEINDFESFEKKNLPICNYIKENDSEGFYRIEKNYMRTRNDNMLLNINGVSHYSSCEKHFIKNFIGKLGLDQYGDVYATYGKGGTSFVDSLLGIKYILSDHKINNYYVPLKTFDDITVYKHENTLPVGIISNQNIKNISIDNLNRFEIQNEMISSITGEDVQILKRYTGINSSYENLNVTVKKDNKFYRKIDDKLTATVKYKIIAKNENPIYIDFTSPKTSSAQVKINGQYQDFDFSGLNRPILKVGEFKEGEEVDVELELLGKRLCVGEVFIYYEDIDLLDKTLFKVREQKSEFERKSSSRLLGMVDIKKGQSSLMFSIPYEEAWNVKVDGKKVDTFKVFDALLGIDLSSGEHYIDIYYVPVSFYKGLFISFSSIVVIIILCMYKNKKQNDT